MSADSEREEDNWTPVAQPIPVQWVCVDLEEAFETVSTNGLKIPEKQYLEVGRFPIVDQGQQFIGGYTDAEDSVINHSGTAIVFGDHTRCFKRVDFPFAPGADGTKVLKPSPALDPKFAYYGLLSLRLPNRGYSRHYSFLRRSKFPIAPLHEQSRIVAKIEELFSELDKGIESLTTAREQIKAYRLAVLKHAYEGALTSEWRAKNRGRIKTAKEVLATLRTDKRNRTKARKDIPTLTTDQIAELPGLPDEWAWCKLNELSIKITDGEHFRPKTQDQGVYFLSAKDVRESGVSLDDPLFIDEETARKARLRCDPEKGDVLIVSRGATVGRMCVVNIDDVFCLLGSVILIKVAPGVETSFLTSALKSPRINRRIVTTSGSTAQQAIYLRDIQHVAVPICSVEEQREIARLLGERLSKADELDAIIDTELLRSESMRQSILKRAFSGLLVSQNASDEPASALLERIRIERDKDGTSRRHSKKNNNKEAT